MQLVDLAIGEIGEILNVIGSREQRMKLLDLGLTPQTRVVVCSSAPMGDPIEIHLRSYFLTLRKEEAALITVIRVEADPTSPTSTKVDAHE